MTLFAVTGAPARPNLAPFQEEAVDVILGTLERRGGALLADGAGLGKSWVAAAVVARWEAEGGVAEIVAPAALLAQWRGVAVAFGLEATVSSHDSLRQGAAAAPGKPRLVVVDEAHRFRNARTRRYRCLALRARDAAVLLVTATPFCNDADDLRALLALIVADDGLADRGIASIDEVFRARRDDELHAILDELSIARDRAALPDALAFVTPATTTVRYRPAGRHRRELDTAIGELSFPLVIAPASGLLRSFLWRRLESSVAALRSTLVRLRKLHARALECAARGVSLDRAGYRAAFGDPDAPLFQDILFPELWGVGERRGVAEPSKLRREVEALEVCIALLDQRLAADPKVDVVGRIVANEGNRRGLVFAQSRDTATSLWRALREARRCALVTGSGCRDSSGGATRLEEVVAMLARGALDLVVATDVGCEGLNLQAASYVVHADLPWSPARLEQRLGRIGRIGQRSARIDEYLVVARQSPVARALRRKRRDRDRFSPRRSSGGASAGPWLTAGAVLEESEPIGLVDIVETRGGREARSLRPIEPDGSIGSPRGGAELLRRIGSRGGACDAQARELVAGAVASWLALSARRELQPARVDAGSPQARLLEAAQRAGLLTPELLDILSRRFRAGTEIEIADLASGAPDARAVEAFCRSVRATPDREPRAMRLAGFVVTRGWLRSATRALRRAR